MRQIPLTQRQFAVVDDQDYELLADFKWCYRAERNGRQGYAVRHGIVDGLDRLIYLHRQLVSAPPGHEVIFLNHDRLDCRRTNLKVVTKQEARQHHRVRSDSKSQIKGVSYDADDGSWTVTVYRNGKSTHLGTFYDEDNARKMYEYAMERENPDLHKAPERVEWTGIAAPDQRGNPDTALAPQGPCG
jgi:hypothetical protein